MSTNEERSTHFQGFAGLLLEKLKPDLAMLFVALSSKREHDIDAAERIIQRVLAESGYDLVKFVVEETKAGTLDTAHFYFDESVEGIPDMTEWPASSDADDDDESEE